MHHVLSGDDVLRMRAISETVRLDDAIIEYIVRLVEATRHNERIQVGSSMRGALALTRCARVWAAADNRGYVCLLYTSHPPVHHWPCQTPRIIVGSTISVLYGIDVGTQSRQ